MSQSVEQIQLPTDQDASGRSFDEDEIRLLTEAIRSGTLTSTKGSMVKQLEASFANTIGVQHAHACSSGTAALHTAVAAIDPEPGDEIITTSITDMGALTPIIYQGAIPVFADVDPSTYNITPESIEQCISERTKAIMVTHLFGNPCRMREIMELARSRGIPVIEDCAQAFLASCDGQGIGTIGDLGCFSLQQGKHITTGEGGIVVSNNDELARRCFLYINKAWGYGDQRPDHYFLALNYRMNELTGAVALSQLGKLDSSVASRIAMAELLHEQLQDVAGIGLPQAESDAVHTYWKYTLDVDPEVIPGGTDAVGAALRSHGIFSAPRYIQKPAFQCQVIRDQCTFGKSRFPFTLARAEAVDYSESKFPGTFAALSRVLVLPWNEKYTENHVTHIATCIRHAVEQLRRAS